MVAVQIVTVFLRFWRRGRWLFDHGVFLSLVPFPHSLSLALAQAAVVRRGRILVLRLIL